MPLALLVLPRGINDTYYENLCSDATKGTHSLYLYSSYLIPGVPCAPPASFLVRLDHLGKRETSVDFVIVCVCVCVCVCNACKLMTPKSIHPPKNVHRRYMEPRFMIISQYPTSWAYSRNIHTSTSNHPTFNIQRSTELVGSTKQPTRGLPNTSPEKQTS